MNTETRPKQTPSNVRGWQRQEHSPSPNSMDGRAVNSGPRRKRRQQMRLVAYARVSMAREEMISPEIQLASIREWAARNGHSVVAEIVDPNATGRNFNRKIQDAIALVERNQATDIAVYKFSRFGRSRRGWELNFGRLEDAGGDLHSSSEDVDATTAVGKFQRGILKEVAAFESDRFSEQWQDAQAYRLHLGLPHTATPRFGYQHHKCNAQPVTSAGWRIRHAKDPECRVEADGRCKEEYRIDPVTGPVLADLYRRYIDGVGLAALAAWCNETGQPRARGGKWYPTAVADLLDSGFGAGLLRVGVQGTKGRPDKHEQIEYRPGAHQAVISPEEWQQYLTRRQALADTSSSLKRTVWPLTGLIKCGLCGGTMTCAGSARGRGYIYRCKAMQNLKTCRGVWRTRAAIEEAVFAELDTVADELARRAKDLLPTVRRQKAAVKTARRRIEKELAEVKAGKKRLIEQVARGVFNDDDIAEKMRELAATEARLKTDQAAATTPSQPVNPAVIRSLREDWHALPVDKAKAMARLLLKEIVCYPEKRITVEVREVLKPPGRSTSRPAAGGSAGSDRR